MNIQFEREALFKEVWETPMRTLAAKYGLSDNGLRKICHTLSIPVPVRGHWAKKAAGHVVFAPELLPTTGPTKYTFRSAQHESFLPPNEELIAWLSERLAFEADEANKVIVAPTLVCPHPLVRQTAKVLDEQRRKLEVSRKLIDAPPKPRAQQRPEIYPVSGLGWEEYLRKGHIELRGAVLPRRTSLEAADRALRLWDALIKACVEREMDISLDVIRGKGRLLVAERGAALELRISERLQETILSTKGMSDMDISFKRHLRQVPTGELRIFVGGRGNEWKIEDDSTGKLENKLNLVLSRIHSTMKFQLDRKAEWAERDRLAKLEREECERQQLALEEHQRLQEIERQRVAALVVEAENWKRAAVTREYIEAVRRRAVEADLSDDNKAVLDAWISWATGAADSMDPLWRRVVDDILVCSKPDLAC